MALFARSSTSCAAGPQSGPGGVWARACRRRRCCLRRPRTASMPAGNLGAVGGEGMGARICFFPLPQISGLMGEGKRWAQVSGLFEGWAFLGSPSPPAPMNPWLSIPSANRIQVAKTPDEYPLSGGAHFLGQEPGISYQRKLFQLARRHAPWSSNHLTSTHRSRVGTVARMDLRRNTMTPQTGSASFRFPCWLQRGPTSPHGTWLSGRT